MNSLNWSGTPNPTISESAAVHKTDVRPKEILQNVHFILCMFSGYQVKPIKSEVV